MKTKCKHKWVEQIYGWGYCKKCKASWYAEALREMLDMNQGIKMMNSLVFKNENKKTK